MILSSRDRVEQLIACGFPASRIAAELDVKLAFVHSVWDHMDEAATGVRPNWNDPTECGTLEGWRKHTKRRTQPCESCRAARDEYKAGRRQPCGTHVGYGRHRRLREIPCKPCLVAEAAYSRHRRQQRRLAAS